MENWEQELKQFKTEHQEDIEEVWSSLNQAITKEQRLKRRQQVMKRLTLAGAALVALLIGATLFLTMNGNDTEQVVETSEVTPLEPSPSPPSSNASEEEELTEGEPGYTEQELTKLNATYPEEQNVPLEIEGTTEQISMVRVVPGSFGYVFYADDERYEISFDETTTSVLARDQLGGEYPEVGFQVEMIPDKMPTEVASEQAALLEAEFPGAPIEAEPVTEPIVGYKLHTRSGDEPSSEVRTIYILDKQHEESTIVITQTVFLEAQEGHGARFHAMLETFTVLD